MLAIKICLYLLMLTRNVDNSKDITISGIAENAKAGAIVMVNRDSIYYVDGLAAWDKTVLGQAVEVTGKLKITNNKPRKNDEEQRGEIVGEKKTLLNATWKVLR